MWSSLASNAGLLIVISKVAVNLVIARLFVNGARLMSINAHVLSKNIANQTEKKNHVEREIGLRTIRRRLGQSPKTVALKLKVMVALCPKTSFKS